MATLRKANRPLTAVWFRVLLLAAIVLAAFAHRPAVSAPTPYELAQYAFPDGTLPVLCTPGSGDVPAHANRSLCDFCLIAGACAPVRPAAADLFVPLPLLLAVMLPPMTAPPVAPVDMATASKRGPPAVSA